VRQNSLDELGCVKKLLDTTEAEASRGMTSPQTSASPIGSSDGPLIANITSVRVFYDLSRVGSSCDLMKVGTAERVTRIRGTRTMSPRSSHCMLESRCDRTENVVSVSFARKQLLEMSLCRCLKEVMLYTRIKENNGR
jgi:hypothetical protein